MARRRCDGVSGSIGCSIGSSAISFPLGIAIAITVQLTITFSGMPDRATKVLALLDRALTLNSNYALAHGLRVVEQDRTGSFRSKRRMPIAQYLWDCGYKVIEAVRARRSIFHSAQ